ncbi:S-adenosyl-L-methionine-dependent methyltransferase [Lipomyces japonicus]|uniref:S-adenosyl-L-methionine-dependent methyltransferase n=1 Tax=Lipomyces japonicus TaxID=56871 RepID=UPI0034D01778
MMLPTPDTTGLDIFQVYEPAEDSFFLLDTLEEEIAYLRRRLTSESSILPTVLELGVGSGVVSTFIQQHVLPNAMFFGTDLNPHACKAALQTSANNNGTKYFEVLRTNLWDGIKPHSVDLLLFNPPYVPEESVPDFEKSEKTNDWLDFALVGGEDGMEITNQVLDHLEEILTKDTGVAYILFCRRNKPLQVVQRMKKNGWTADLVGERKAGWELLSIYRFTQPT